jgi:phage tail-like protein
MSVPTLSLAAILGLQNRFLVTIDGINLGGWGKCTGLKVDFNPLKIIEGGNYDNENILPGQVKYADITLERAIEPAGSAVVQRWLSGRVNGWVNATGSAHGLLAQGMNAVGSMLGVGDIGGAAGGTGSITLCSAEGKPLISWSLRNVYPFSWSGPDMDALSVGIAREKLVLCHEGFL